MWNGSDMCSVGPPRHVSEITVPKSSLMRHGCDACSVDRAGHVPERSVPKVSRSDVRVAFARRMRRRRDESLQSQPSDADPVAVEVQQELPRFTCKCGQTYVLTVASF